MNYTKYLTHFTAVFTILTVSLECLLMLTVSVVMAEDCGQEELSACAKPLQILTETSELSFVTKKSELEKLCPDLHIGLHCIRSYTRRCMNMQQREHFNKLYHGTGEVIHELCEEGPYQEDFLRHAPCMRHVKNEYEICSKRYQYTMAKIIPPADQYEYQRKQAEADRYNRRYDHHHQQPTTQPPPAINNTKGESEEEQGIKAVCCAFKEYIACSEHTVRRKCGDDAAYFTRSFLDKIANSLMRMHCEGFEAIPGQCGEPSTASRILTIKTTIITICLTIIIIIMSFTKKLF